MTQAMNINPRQLWDKCMRTIRGNVSEQQYSTWFGSMSFEAYKKATNTVVVRVPSMFVYEYIEENYLDLLSKTLTCNFGVGVKLSYHVLTDKTNNITQNIQSETTADIDAPRPRETANQPPSVFDTAKVHDIDPQLDLHRTFENFIEGVSNKLPRSVGMSMAENPCTTQFNPMFVYGPTGCGKTHLINAIGVRAKELHPGMRVLYVSARLFQVQYSNAVLQNHVNDFISFYQTIDVLIVDDIQEWATAAKTQQTFFHIFNHLFRNGKRIILASDRPPVDLKGMSERLLTRFSCGLIAELEKPDKQLCVDILNDRIRRDGLKIPHDVVTFIAETANGSVRDLEGIVNSLLAYSIVYSSPIDMRLASRVIKRSVKADDRPLTVEDIVQTVCDHYNVSVEAMGSRSRRRELVIARQVAMYLAQKHTKMPAARIGKLVAGRDHSTVVHSCKTVERLLMCDDAFSKEVSGIESLFRLKGAS